MFSFSGDGKIGKIEIFLCLTCFGVTEVGKIAVMFPCERRINVVIAGFERATSAGPHCRYF